MTRLGKYIAEVKDNADPEGRLRVRVFLPEIFGSGLSPWVYACLPPGSWSAPAVGSLVIVEPSNENLINTLWFWTGVFITKKTSQKRPTEINQESIGKPTTSVLNDHGRDPLPESSFATQYPNNHVRRTPGGLGEEVDDTKGKERYKRFHPSGGHLEINEGGSESHSVPGKWTELSQSSDVRVKQDYHLRVMGKYELTINDKYYETMALDYETKMGDLFRETKNLVLDVKGDERRSVLGQYSIQTGAFDLTVGSMWDQFIGRGLNTTVVDAFNLLVVNYSNLIPNEPAIQTTVYNGSIDYYIMGVLNSPNSPAFSIRADVGSKDEKYLAGGYSLYAAFSAEIEAGLEITLKAPLVSLGLNPLGGLVIGGPLGTMKCFITGAPLVGSQTCTGSL